MHAVTAVGLDIAKSVFQVHGIDAEGKAVVQRKLKRRYVLASASHNASATIAFFLPQFLAIFIAQALSQDHFLVYGSA